MAGRDSIRDLRQVQKYITLAIRGIQEDDEDKYQDNLVSAQNLLNTREAVLDDVTDDSVATVDDSYL